MSQAKVKEKTSNSLTKTNRNKKFELQKNKLKNFSKELPKSEDLPVVQESGGLFGLFSYSVKGDDLNRLTGKIQDKMILQNKLLVKIVKEFHTIYDTFSVLDEEYIQAILKSLSAAEEANKKALTSIEGVKINQDSIGSIIDQQWQMIDVLKKFKEDIGKIKHIHDVDELYDTFAPVPAKIKAMEADIFAHLKSIDKLNDETMSIHNLLNKLKGETTEKATLLERQIASETRYLEEKLLANKESLEEKQLAIQKNISELSKETSYQFESVNTSINELSTDTNHQITLITNNLDKRFTEHEQTQEAAMNTLESGLENKLTSLEKAMEAEVGTLEARLQDETDQLRQSLGEHKDLIDHLSQSLKLTKIISFSGIIILLILIILMISGVF